MTHVHRAALSFLNPDLAVGPQNLMIGLRWIDSTRDPDGKDRAILFDVFG
jgi:hypothetical protein